MFSEHDAFGSSVRLSDPTACPYGYPNAHRIRYFLANRCASDAYEAALAAGWRRSGLAFYKNACDRCASCVPIRIDARSLSLTKGQRRCARRNEDVSVTLGRPEYRDEDYALFRDYLRARHPEEAGRFNPDEYRAAYIHSPLESALARYRTADGRIIAIGFLDLLPNGVSSVYFAFDPGESARSLGTFSVIAECSLLKTLGKRWYYLGFWVKDCAKMSYKNKYSPHELAEDGSWNPQRKEIASC